jgi:hypothetical protein
MCAMLDTTRLWRQLELRLERRGGDAKQWVHALKQLNHA